VGLAAHAARRSASTRRSHPPSWFQVALSRAFGAGPQGVYYVACDPSANPPLHVLDLETGRDRLLGTLEGLQDRPLGLAVSPDGKTIVYPRAMHTDADLMLIENFR
jgi:hypothetical protein